MYVTDVRHFHELSPEAPGPARKLAEHLTAIVSAASAGDVHTTWETALPCRRRPANRRCPGRISVLCDGPDHPISWRCVRCGDNGVITNWAESLYDLRRLGLTAVEPRRDISVSAEVAAILRTVLIFDDDVQRAIFLIRAEGDDLRIALSDDERDELLDSVAAESNREPNRRRRRQLDAAYDVLVAAGRLG